MRARTGRVRRPVRRRRAHRSRRSTPPRTVKPMTVTGRPSTSTTTPAAPFTSTGRSSAPGSENMIALDATVLAPRSTPVASGRLAPPSDRTTTSGSSTATSRSRSPPRAAAKNASTTSRWRDRSASGTGAPWTRRRPRLASWRVAVGRAIEDRRDLVERHGEQVVQDEREPLGGRERLDHDVKCETDRVREHGRLLGIVRVLTRDHRIGDVHAHRVLRMGRARAQPVQADATP